MALIPASHWTAPGYLAQLKAKREQVLANMSKPMKPKNGDGFLPLPSTAVPSVQSCDLAAAKTKHKTNGVAVELAELEIENNPIEELPATAAVQLRDTRSLPTFEAMFPTVGAERQRTIKWTAFVDGMADAGFESRDVGGSMIPFEPHSGTEEAVPAGRIVFHQPHPETKIATVVLQGMGKRLSKWFGWVQETFVLAKE